MADDDATRIQRALADARKVVQSSNNRERNTNTAIGAVTGALTGNPLVAATQAVVANRQPTTLEQVQFGGTVSLGEAAPPKGLPNLRDQEKRDRERMDQIERQPRREPSNPALEDAMRRLVDAELAAIDAKYDAALGRLGRPATPPTGKAPSGGRPR